MTNVDVALRELHRSEAQLARAVTGMMRRQASDQDAVHVGQLLASWARTHVRRLAEVGGEYDVRLASGVDPEPTVAQVVDGVVDRVTRAIGELVTARPDSGMALLAELRRVHLAAAAASVDWVVLGQAAQALRDEVLLDLVQECHPETLRTMRWANGRIKEAAPQAIATS
jgi:hypothetical protein